MNKRTDTRGRRLKQGEGQRKDGLYFYRYKGDVSGKWKYLYAKTLNELREKEKKALKDQLDGIGGELADLTVAQLIERHIKIRKKLRDSSIESYNSLLKSIQKFGIANMKVSKVKKSNVVSFCLEANSRGYGFGTINLFKSLMSSSFIDAVGDEAIRINPANFPLSDHLDPNEVEEVKALTDDEVSSLLDWLRGSKFKRHYDLIMFMLETGLRVGEVCGLTISDVDFQNHQIRIDKQLHRVSGKTRTGDPKSKKGFRFVPLSPKAEQAMRNILSNRKPPKVEQVISGHGRFIFLSRRGNPQLPNGIEKQFDRIEAAYNNVHPDHPIVLEPHVMRHTFVTQLSNKKVSPKTILALMGDNTARMLQIYDDAQYDVVKDEFMQAVGEG